MSAKKQVERLDRLMSRLGYGSRSSVKGWIREGWIEVAGEPATSPAQKVYAGDVLLEGAPVDHPFGLTVIYHKPIGSVCSHKEQGKLIYDDFPERWNHRNPSLSSVGRLDKDTSGLLILTDDGALNHALTSPKRHISKTYAATVTEPLNESLIQTFASGTLMLEEDDRPCLPAELVILDATHAQLTLHEGRYHQVRRMFAAAGNHVEALSRTHIGKLSLEQTALKPGECRSISPEDLMQLIRPENK